MKIRDTAREVRNTPRYLSIELEGRDTHHFRLPTYGAVGKLVEAAGGLKDIKARAEQSSGEALTVAADTAGLLIGVCWWNRTYDLETPAPRLRSMSMDEMLDYGDTIVDELMEEEYSFSELQVLLAPLVTAVLFLLSEKKEAAEVADFSAPQPAA